MNVKPAVAPVDDLTAALQLLEGARGLVRNVQGPQTADWRQMAERWAQVYGDLLRRRAGAEVPKPT